ncbi:MAG: ATP-binding protein [Promethearchaeota archaeon]|jgi:DNA repair exonuclease SbcCD ATPase subunit
MVLKRISILSHGPLRKLDLNFKNGLNIIYGPNGSGKTIILDAIHKLLLGKKNVKKKKHHSFKIDDYPLGEVVLKEDNTEKKYTGKESIEEHSSLSSEDLENIFVTKDGSLKLEDEKKFYEDIIPRLIGLKIDDINTVIKKVLELGRLTEKLNLLDTKPLGKPKTRLSEAKELLSDVRDFLDDLVDKKQPSSFQISELKFAKKELQERLNQLEQARKINQLKLLDGHLQKATARIDQMKELDRPEIRELEQQYNEYKGDPKEFEDYQEEMKGYRRYSIYFFLITIIPIIPMLLIPSLMILVLPTIAGLGGLVWCLFQEINARKKRNDKKRLKDDILSVIKVYNLPVKKFEDLLGYLKKDEEKKNALRKEIQEATGVMRDTYPDASTDDGRFNYDSFKLYLNNQMKNFDMNLALKYDEEEIQLTLDRITRLEEEVEELSQLKDDFDKKIQKFANEASKLEPAFEEFLKRDFRLEINNIDSLETLTINLEELIQKIETERDVSIEVHNILKRIYQKETEKIARYFNEETQIATLMEKVSNGLFKQVQYNPEQGSFYLLRKGDIEQDIGQLSRGELSQLYFVVRLALAMRLLEQGFILMEDPFLPSDEERLEEQLKILANFVDEGWQVIFFTAKEDMKKKLQDNEGTLIKELERI